MNETKEQTGMRERKGHDYLTVTAPTDSPSVDYVRLTVHACRTMLVQGDAGPACVAFFERCTGNYYSVVEVGERDHVQGYMPWLESERGGVLHQEKVELTRRMRELMKCVPGGML